LVGHLPHFRLREVLLDSKIKQFKRGEIVLRENDYTNSLWLLVEGSVFVADADIAPAVKTRLKAGEFFGELALLSGRRRTKTVESAEDSVLIEIPRFWGRRLQRSNEAFKAEVDRVAVRRLLHSTLAPAHPIEDIEPIIAASDVKDFKRGATVIEEGTKVDALYIMRSGSATVSRTIDGRDVILDYIAAGSIFGERGFLAKDSEEIRRAATVTATIASQIIRIDAVALQAASQELPELEELFTSAVQRQVQKQVDDALRRANRLEPNGDEAAIANFLAREGIGEAFNAFIIDEALCTRCGNCETACAATHGGISRVNREAGARAYAILLPVACRHCENPHCMSDCPALGAIERAPSGEVVIDYEKCIRCGKCAENCPYEVIHMTPPPQPNAPRSWLSSLIDGVGLGALLDGESEASGGRGKKVSTSKLPMKCDLCHGSSTGVPACVSACPTGAALRTDPETYIKRLGGGRSAA
jgi:CRP-like cAMP-binding protein/Fe-S-cluster-containing hydrogenase component 2